MWRKAAIVAANERGINLKEFFRETLFSYYPIIVQENLKKLSELEVELNKLKQRTAHSEEEALFFANDELPIIREIDKCSLIAIVFSALAVEAYIYDYGARKFSDTFIQKYLDKLDVISKWVVIPQLATGQELSRDSQAFELLKKLIRERNNIIHYKSSDIDPEKLPLLVEDNENYLLERAKEAYLTLEELAKELEKIDPEEPVLRSLVSKQEFESG